MRTQIISCKTIQKEVEIVIRETGCSYPVSWVDSGLHNVPKKLNAALQELLDGVNAERVLLAMGFCGNSLEGLLTRDFQLIYPRVDDCITMLLGSFSNRQRFQKTYFLTRGWIDGERNIFEEYKYTIEKYGQEQGKEIFSLIMNHYENLGVLDTGVCDYDKLLEEARTIASTLGFALLPIDGTNVLLKQLITGPWPDNKFVTINKNTTICLKDLRLA